MATFFFSDNPISLFLAFVVTVIVVKAWLSKRKMFSDSKSAYILPVLIIFMILLIAYRPLLSMLSFGIPFFVLICLFVFGVSTVLFTLGMDKPKIWPMLKSVGPFSIALKIAVICIIAFAASHVYGEKLLEDTSVSFADSFAPQEDAVKIDFAPLFTKQALGLIMMITVLGLAFLFLNLQ
ncbi:MAG: hypothetical protein ABIA62_03660 [Candidatus Woesearchaeota archaeon]